MVCEIEISHMGKNNGNSALVCDNDISELYFSDYAFQVYKPFIRIKLSILSPLKYREHSGRVLDSRQRGRGFELTGITALCPLARHINPS